MQFFAKKRLTFRRSSSIIIIAKGQEARRRIGGLPGVYLVNWIWSIAGERPLRVQSASKDGEGEPVHSSETTAARTLIENAIKLRL